MLTKNYQNMAHMKYLTQFWCKMVRKWGQDAIFNFIFWKICIFVIFRKVGGKIAKNGQIEAKNGVKCLTPV